MKNFPKNILIFVAALCAAMGAGCEFRVHPPTKPAITHQHGTVYHSYHDNHYNGWVYTDDCYYDEDIYQQYGYYYWCETVYCYDYYYDEYYIWDEECFFVD